MQQADRLLTEVSSEFRAVDSDLGGVIGEQLARAIVNLLERDVDGAGDMRLHERRLRQDVEDSERRIVEAALQLVAGDLVNGG
jgi:hypothetical protein